MRRSDLRNFPWTESQRRALLVFLTPFALFLACQSLLKRITLDDPFPARPPGWEGLCDRLDPNAATWQEFAAISGLGQRRARAIVAFRNAWRSGHSGELAFRRPEDLRAIKGIGPATIANMQPYLVFPDSPPARTMTVSGHAVFGLQ